MHHTPMVSTDGQLHAAPFSDWRSFDLRVTGLRGPSLSYHDLVSVLCNAEGKPQMLKANWTQKPFYACFKQQPSSEHTRSFMLGTLMDMIRQQQCLTPVIVNPTATPEQLLKSFDSGVGEINFEDVLWSPLKSPLNGKLMSSSPDDALALLAIEERDQNRFGINFVFHMISSKETPDAAEERLQYLRNKIDELAHFIPRIPIAFGSASIYCVLLNLDNPMEEFAFIRDYKTFDSYSDVLFVTSNLDLFDGKLKTISYNGEAIDTIFGPIISWQSKNNPMRSHIERTRQSQWPMGH